MTAVDFTDPLASALWLAGRGFAVHPLDHPGLDRCAGVRTGEHDPATCTERGKHPCTKWSDAATSDPGTIAAWFAGTRRNVGVACKPSRLLVIDEDAPGGFEKYAASIGATIPATFTVRTGRGRHFYFQRPDGPDIGNARAALTGFGVDVRGGLGRGGYVVAPGSLHASGVLYEPDDPDVAVAPAPDWLVDALRLGPRPADWAQWEAKPRGLAAVPDVIRGPRADGPGDRHQVLVSYASSLRARDVPMPEAVELFRLVWQRCEQPPACVSPLTWDEARGKLESCYALYLPNRPRPEVTVLDGPDDPESADSLPGESWAPVDLSAVVAGILSGDLARLEPTVGARDDGTCLLYSGKVNGIAGASGAGKSFTATHGCRQEIAAGHHVVYVDLEDDPAGTVGRLLDMGADPDDIVKYFHYIRPDEAHTVFAQARLVEVIAAYPATLVVIDSTGEGMALDGAKPNDDDDTARWFRKLPGAVAKLGPAVLVLDHVVKADDGGLWPIGSQRKRAAISGAQYMQSILKPFARDHGGAAKLVCAKDRHGTYRPGQKVAELLVEPDGDAVSIVLKAPEMATADGSAPFRPTALMERVSRFIETSAEPPSRNDVHGKVTGKKTTVLEALDVLKAEGFVTVTVGPRKSELHTSARAYRQEQNPRSDRYVRTGDPVDDHEQVPSSPGPVPDWVLSKEKDPGPSQDRPSDRVPGPSQDPVGTQSEKHACPDCGLDLAGPPAVGCGCRDEHGQVP